MLRKFLGVAQVLLVASAFAVLLAAGLHPAVFWLVAAAITLNLLSYLLYKRKAALDVDSVQTENKKDGQSRA